jgi:mannose-6-phosphate isomerase-like protein (cupin superfamily)
MTTISRLCVKRTGQLVRVEIRTILLTFLIKRRGYLFAIYSQTLSWHLMYRVMSVMSRNVGQFFETKILPRTFDYIAPDNSEIRKLLDLSRGGLALSTLTPGLRSIAKRHKSVQEIWYVMHGRGEIWRKQGAREEVATLEPGVCITIPTSVHFQFRNTSDTEPLNIIIATMPIWPGQDEAEDVENSWKIST